MPSIYILISMFQVCGHLVQEAEVRLCNSSHEHQDRVQGQLQVRGSGEAVGRQCHLGRQATGRRVLENRQIFSHLISNLILRLQHNLLAGIYSVKEWRKF